MIHCSSPYLSTTFTLQLQPVQSAVGVCLKNDVFKGILQEDAGNGATELQDPIVLGRGALQGYNKAADPARRQGGNLASFCDTVKRSDTRGTDTGDTAMEYYNSEPPLQVQTIIIGFNNGEWVTPEAQTLLRTVRSCLPHWNNFPIG